MNYISTPDLLSKIKLNGPVNGYIFLLLLLSFLVYLIIFFSLLILFLQKIGPYYISSQTDFVYQYYYSLPDYLDELQLVFFGFAYLIFWVISACIIFMWLTIYLKDKIKWTRPEEFPSYEKNLKTMKKLIIPALLGFIFLLYSALDTYLLIGDDRMIYNSLWSFNEKSYQFQDIKSIDTLYSRKQKSSSYHILFKDGTKLMIDLDGAKFLSQKTNLPIQKK